MKVLVCGGREYADVHRVNLTLTELHAKHGITLLIHGAARGADTLAASWARYRGIDVLAFPADWAKHGDAAGPIRNQQMLDEGKPDLVVAFPGKRGTASMISKAHKAGVRVLDLTHQ